ncbi:dihydroorotase [Vaginisenegalia massiliensis]|uniref:dihydroorotase n=1 Tax=Vaginisenegalia massiliensis TaxID=2058294 RepID=UPI000F531F80|nr:dihydroorotase [Vaginisenegalia massiliensis]
MRLVIKNAQIIERDNELKRCDILIEDGFIKQIQSVIEPDNNDQVLDVEGHFVSPGLVDVHVHLREPGACHKETIATGSLAAAHGGFTSICAMPNLNPCPDNPAKLASIQEIIKKDAVVKVHQYACISENLKSDILVDFAGLKEQGAFAFTNDGVGVQTAGTMYLAMQAAADQNMALVAHTEDNSLLFGGVMHAGHKAQELGLPGILSITEASQIARDLLLAEATGVHYHVCHVSTKESVRVIRDAKKAGIHVTAEVTPHHLLLSEEDILSDDAMWKMNPPLRSEMDRQALIEGLLDGTLDMIATDHAPHAADEKAQGFLKAPFGIVGSETAFQLIYTHFVKQHIFTLEQVIQWMATKPASLFNLPVGQIKEGYPADLAVFDLDQSYTINKADFLSKSNNTPFDQWPVYGPTLYTLVDGQIVWQAKGGPHVH